MSHITGTIQFVNPVLVIGPDSGLPASSPNTWAVDFAHAPAPTGTQLLILHFTGAAFPPGSKLEVDLGYGAGEKDVFTSADGSDFWTRPINPYGLTAGKVAIRYISGGAATGSVHFDVYGRGERHSQDPTNTTALLSSYSNSDPFLDPAHADYLEPDYAKLWVCGSTPNWENVDCIKPPGDIRNTVAPAVGMIVHADYNKILGGAVSTCTVTLVAPDIVVTAGHCMQDPIEDAASASIIFGYQLQCNGKRAAGYKPAVHKVKEVIRQRCGGRRYRSAGRPREPMRRPLFEAQVADGHRSIRGFLRRECSRLEGTTGDEGVGQEHQLGLARGAGGRIEFGDDRHLPLNEPEARQTVVRAAEQPLHLLRQHAPIDQCADKRGVRRPAGAAPRVTPHAVVAHCALAIGHGDVFVSDRCRIS